MNFKQIYSELIKKYLGRYPDENEGNSDQEILEIEKKLKTRVPKSLKEYYRIAGKVSELNKKHNYFYDIQKLEIENGYLMFQDENQSVVSWGFPLSSIDQEDPFVWQRNNTPPIEWFSEEMTLPDFFDSMFAWYLDEGIIQE